MISDNWKDICNQVGRVEYGECKLNVESLIKIDEIYRVNDNYNVKINGGIVPAILDDFDYKLWITAYKGSICFFEISANANSSFGVYKVKKENESCPIGWEFVPENYEEGYFDK